MSGIGTDVIAGKSTLEFDSLVSNSKTVGAQNIDFTLGGTLYLTDPKGFWGEISGFAKNDAIDLLGSWSLSSFSEVSGVGELTLKSGTAKHTFDFVGNYAQTDFNIVSGSDDDHHPHLRSDGRGNPFPSSASKLGKGCARLEA